MYQWEVTAFDDDGHQVGNVKPARDYADAWRIALVAFEGMEVARVMVADHAGSVVYRITVEPPEDAC